MYAVAYYLVPLHENIRAALQLLIAWSRTVRRQKAVQTSAYADPEQTLLLIGLNGAALGEVRTIDCRIMVRRQCHPMHLLLSSPEGTGRYRSRDSALMEEARYKLLGASARACCALT